MCREAAVPELAARIPGIKLVQMWVCDLVMSRFIIWRTLENTFFEDALFDN